MNIEFEKKFRELGGVVPVGKTFAPITEEELRSIETTLGVTLPDDYRDFVGKYGASSFGELVQFRFMAGEPVHPVQSLLPIRVPRYEIGPFSDFYGSTASTNSLARYIGIYKTRMPDTMMPIANDGGGNQICLGIKGTEQGKVYYWDHHNEWDEQDYLEDYGKPMPPEVKFQNVYLVAESFMDFVDRLKKI